MFPMLYNVSLNKVIFKHNYMFWSYSIHKPNKNFTAYCAIIVTYSQDFSAVRKSVESLSLGTGGVGGQKWPLFMPEMDFTWVSVHALFTGKEELGGAVNCQVLVCIHLLLSTNKYLMTKHTHTRMQQTLNRPLLSVLVS